MRSLNKKSQQLIDDLTIKLNQYNFIMLIGIAGVGKTFMALEVAKNIATSEDITVVSFHPGYSYNEFVRGIRANTESGKLLFDSVEGIFLKQINYAATNTKKNVVILIDDINRCDAAATFGDIYTSIDAFHQDDTRAKSIEIPKNLFIIATMNPNIENAIGVDYSLFRRFFTYELQNDYSYITMTNEENQDGDQTIPSKRAGMYEKVNKIVDDYINDNLKENAIDFYLGHGYFSDGDHYKDIIRYKVKTMLNQYIAEGILKKNAATDINNLMPEGYTNRYSEIESFDVVIENMIKVKSELVTALRNWELQEFNPTKESLSNQGISGPKIIQKLLLLLIETKKVSNYKILTEIMLSDKIVRRTFAHDTEEEVGNLCLFGDDFSHYKNKYRFENKGKTVNYSMKDILLVDGRVLHMPSQTPPVTYSPDKETGKEGELERLVKLEKVGVSFVAIVHRIIVRFYEVYISELEEYSDELKMDRSIQGTDLCNNIEILCDFVKRELQAYLNKFGAASKDEKGKQVYKNLTVALLKEFWCELKILWAKVDDSIEDENGETIKVIGVYGMKDKKTIIEIMDKIQVRQMILQGPPGTSKTYSAMEMIDEQIEKFENQGKINVNERDEKREAYKIVNYEDYDKDFGWDIVQFHPSYGYEDFVRGISVGTSAGGTVVYDTINKSLGKMAKLAASKKYAAAKDGNNNKESKFFLIIDEINRANLATVFGELIYALEYRDKPVQTPYRVDNSTSSELTIPDNLYIIGTMNTADKSVGSIDYAIRRRFLFFPMLPDENIINLYYENKKMINESGADHDAVKEFAVNLFNTTKHFFENLNEDYFKDDVQIGHTYFLAADKDALELKFKHQVLPVLREYNKDGLFNHKGKQNELQNSLWNLIERKNLETKATWSEEDELQVFFNRVAILVETQNG